MEFYMNKIKLQSATIFDTALQELKSEAESLFGVLDTFSSQIASLEQSLKATKANFPFKKEIAKETGAFIYRTKPEHEIDFYEARHYYNSICWYIGWEIDENSKEFRLLLISEKHEIVFYTRPGWDSKFVIFKSEILTKQPLIETKLAIRLNCFGHLLEFLNDFTKYLNNCHKSIKEGSEPFKVNETLDGMLRRHEVLDHNTPGEVSQAIILDQISEIKRRAKANKELVISSVESSAESSANFEDLPF